MKNIFIEAHKLTKEMVKKYDVDYQAQFGINLSYLLENKEEEEMVNLKGTEKQIKYANDIISDINKMFIELEQYVEENKMKKFSKRKEKTLQGINEIEDAKEIIETFKDVLYTGKILGKALKLSEIFARKNMLSKAAFTNSVEQFHYDRYYDEIDNLK